MAVEVNQHTMRSYVTTYAHHMCMSCTSRHRSPSPSMFLDVPVFRAAKLFQFGQGCFEIPGRTTALARRTKKTKKIQKAAKKSKKQKYAKIKKKHGKYGNRFGDGLNPDCFDLLMKLSNLECLS